MAVAYMMIFMISRGRHGKSFEAPREPPGLDSTMVTFIAAKSRHLNGFQSFWMFWKGLMPLSTIMQELKCPEMSGMPYGAETRPGCPEMSGNHNTCENRVQKKRND